MKKFFVSLCFALGLFILSKTNSYAYDVTYYDKNNYQYGFDIPFDNVFAYQVSPDDKIRFGIYYPNGAPPQFNLEIFNVETGLRTSYLSGRTPLYIKPNFYQVYAIDFIYRDVEYPYVFFNSVDSITIPPAPISKSDVIDSFGGDGFNINGSLNGNTVDVFKCNPFRLLSSDYMYYEVSIKSLKQFSGSKAIVKLIGDRSTYSHTVSNPFLTSFDTIPVDDYVSVNSDFFMVCTPIDSDDNYGNSIVYKYRLTQDGIVSVYDEPIDTPKGLNVDINNNYLPVTQINKNRAFVTNINYSTVTYNDLNVQYSNTWDVYYAPNISTSNDNISIQNISDSYNTYNYVTNNYNDLTYGLGLNFDFGDNDISDDGNVIDTLDNIKMLLSFLPWLLGLFTFVPTGFVTVILGGFAIILVVVVVKIFK